MTPNWQTTASNLFVLERQLHGVRLAPLDRTAGPDLGRQIQHRAD